MKAVFIFLTFALFCTDISAQVDSIPERSTVDRVRWLKGQTGSVVIHQSKEISALMDTLATRQIPLEGYRIQLSFGRKDEVNEIRTEFLQEYPDCRAYVSWLQPNFRLRVGDFRTKLQAERFRNEILEDYPSCYIVRDVITPPSIN